MKTYGKFTDCSGDEQSLDEFHLHELLDRVSLIRYMWYNYVASHPAAKLLEKDIDIAGAMMGRIYQKIGAIHFEDDDA